MVYSEFDIQKAVKLAENLGLVEFLYRDPRGQRTSRCNIRRHSSRSSHSSHFSRYSSKSSRSYHSSRYSSRSSRNPALLAIPVALLAIPATLFGIFVSVMSAVPTTVLSHRSSRDSSRRSSGNRWRRHSSRSSHPSWGDYRSRRRN